ncbi:hypothetical protein Dsin_022247 [Dipteronia sinensis]|uniref:Uncharacterized protein n=1 Tax=Dipteronia sinensis TaxID=43782 RepID=A0AAE0A234_9ROSI|nr:hypothetical protein Dsin_022247 [Dipteronia sinensis]
MLSPFFIFIYSCCIFTSSIHNATSLASLPASGYKSPSPSSKMRTRQLPHPTRVKNKTPSPIQISAEQILRKARVRQEAEIRPPKKKITDSAELADYRLRKRKEFEDVIHHMRWNISV